MKSLKYISLMLIMVMVFNIIAPTVALAEDTYAPISISNGTTEYRVNRHNGRFTIHTNDGIPNKQSDNDKNLLFLGKDNLPNTSFTTFRIDGEDYIFGNSYGILGNEGKVIGETTVDGKLTTTVWKIKDITITQKLFLIVDESNPNIGNTKIIYEVSNAGTKPVQIGSRILLDTQLGANDASAMIVGTSYITNETIYEGTNVPVSWKSSEKQFAPDVVSYGLLSGWENIAPTKFAVGHWENLSSTKWDFTPDEKINFTTNKNSFGTADSGAAVYFDPQTLENGKDLIFETFYGIGSTSDTYSDVALGIQLNSPLKLTVNDTGTGYNEQEFEVVVSLDNNIEGGETLNDVAINIGMSEELSLAEDQVDTQFIKVLKYGETTTVNFKLKAKPCQNLKVAEYGIAVKYGDNFAEASKYIVLPSIKGTPPKMQMNEISPKIFYTKTNKKKAVIKGSDFNSLKADYEWTMSINSKVTNKGYEIKRKDILIEDDTLTVNIDNSFNFDAQDYEIVIESKSYGRLSKTVTMSSDSKYDRKEYGVMVIGAFDPPLGSNSRDRYSVKLFESEEALDALDEETQDKILLTFKGEIYSYVINGVEYYDCDPGTIINNAIKYTPPVDKPKQPMTIRRYEGVNNGIPRFGTVVDSLVLSGSGKLSIADYNFHSGDFYIKLDDREDYELADAAVLESKMLSGDTTLFENGGAAVEIVTPANEIITGVFSAVSLFLGLNITVSNAIIGTNTVSLGGSVSMELPWWAGGGDDDDDGGGDDGLNASQKKAQEKFDKNEGVASGFGAGKQDESILSLNMEEMRYGIKNNSSYLVGLKADGGINLTGDSIPMLKAGGAKAGFEINSLDYPGMYAAVNGGFSIGDAFEAEATIAVIIETSGDSYLDSIELVMGGDLMRIPLAGLGFLTKLGGGVSGLYDTCKGNFSYLPPIMLKLISGYADPTMFSFQLDTIGVEFGPRGFQFTAEDGKIVGIDLIDSAYAKLLMYENDNKELCLDMGAGISMNFLGILKGEASVWLIYDPTIDGIFGPVSLGGKAYVGVFLPEWLPLVGGLELLSVMAELSTRRVFLGIKVIGIPISIGYYWDSGEVKFFDTFAQTVDENGNVIIPPEELSSALAVDFQTVDGKNTATVYGSNLRKTYSSDDVVTLFGEELLTHTIPVQDQAYGLFELNYQGAIPKITVTRPDNTPFELIKDVNYMVQTIPADKTESGTEENKVFISVENPQNGNWTITTDKAIQCDAMDVLPIPEIKNVTAKQLPNNKVEVNWDALNIDENYMVDIHASKAQDKEVDLLADEITQENAADINAKLAENYDVGIRIAENIKASDKKAIIDLGDRLLDGDYQIRVVLKKGPENFASELSANNFTYNNPKTPAQPTNVNVSLGGDGLFKVTYNAVTDADGYYIQILDKNGTPLEGVAPTVTKDTSAYAGGVFEVATEFDANNKATAYKQLGVTTGSEYKVSVSSFREENSIKYESTSYISNAIMLPTPNPAKISIAVDGKDTVQGDDNNENIRKALTNKTKSTITFTPNQDIEMMYKLNGEFPKSDDSYLIKANKPFDLDLNLNEGENHLSLYSKNNANDYTTMEVIINVDTVPPELMIDNTTVMSVDGKYEIIGTPETDAFVYINDSLEPIAQVDGVFTYRSVQTDTHDEVKITAIDKAGNENTMYINVIPSELSSFKKIIVKKQVGTSYVTLTQEEKMEKNSEMNVSVFGVDANNKEYRIDNSEVKYSLVAGNGILTINENGTINTKYPGDAIILCEFFPTESYSFEEVIGINVKDVFEQATDIRISKDEILGNLKIGSEVARLSVPNSPLGIKYDFSINQNEYFDLKDNILIVKKPLNVESYNIIITAMGKHIINGAYSEIGKPVSKTFTIKSTKDIISVEPLNSVQTFVRCDFIDAPLPKTVKVTLNTGEKLDLDVSWQKGAFNKSIANTYTLKGILNRPDGVLNTNALAPVVQLNVEKRKIIFDFDTVDAVQYTGGNLSPEITVKDGTTPLIKGSDFVAVYKDNKNVGRGVITLTGINDYEGSTGTAYFTITPKPLSLSTATIADKVYDGNAEAKVESLTYKGLVNNDDVKIITSAQFENENFGISKTVKVTPLSLIGVDNKNYQLQDTPILTTGNITKADVNIFISNKLFKYDGLKKGISISSIPNLPQSDFTVKYYYINNNTVNYENPKNPTNVGKYLYVIEENNQNYTIPNKALLGDGKTIPTGVNVGILEIFRTAQSNFPTTESSEIYTITVTQTEGGKISPNTVEVDEQSNKTFTITADYGYEIVDVSVNNKSVGKVSKFTFENISANSRITATFKKIDSNLFKDFDSDLTEWKNPFIDVKSSDWFYNAVKFVNGNSLMNGINTNEFAPNEAITRAMFVTVLYRTEKEPETAFVGFSDVNSSEYYAKSVSWAKENGIINGISDTEFAPNAKITREQMATIIYRYAKFKGIDLAAEKSNYADQSNISDYAKSAVDFCTSNKIMCGKENNAFAPQDNATRAEAAAVLQRIINH